MILRFYDMEHAVIIERQTRWLWRQMSNGIPVTMEVSYTVLKSSGEPKRRFG